MPTAKSEFIRRMLASLGNVFAVRERRTVTKWTVVAICGLLAVCAEIGEAAARGRYSNFGPWSSNYSQATGISATPRPNVGGPRRGVLVGISKKDLKQREASHKRHRFAGFAQ
jgi:hypothetical protein